MERVEELIYYNFQNRRPYASFFEWKNPDDPSLGKKIKERGIVCDLIESLEKDTGQPLFKAVRYGEDPPDSVATDTLGNSIGFEVTELVDQRTIEARCRGFGERKEWKTGELLNMLNDILWDKSLKLKKSSYTRNILVIYTDEPDLRRNFCNYEIENSKHWFEKAPNIDEAFLLFSYIPGKEKYPYLKLNFR